WKGWGSNSAAKVLIRSSSIRSRPEPKVCPTAKSSRYRSVIRNLLGAPLARRTIPWRVHDHRGHSGVTWLARLLVVSCPRCEFADPGPIECPRCGVVFARLDRPSHPARAAPVAKPRWSGLRFSWLDAALAAILAVSAGLIWAHSAPPPPPARGVAVALPPRVQPEATTLPPASRPDWETPPDTQPALTPGFELAAPQVPSPMPLGGVAIVPPASVSAMLPEDVAVLGSLSKLVSERREIAWSHVEQAASLYGRYAAVPGVSWMLMEVIDLGARQASSRGQLPEAARFRER